MQTCNIWLTHHDSSEIRTFALFYLWHFPLLSFRWRKVHTSIYGKFLASRYVSTHKNVIPKGIKNRTSLTNEVCHFFRAEITDSVEQLFSRMRNRFYTTNNIYLDQVFCRQDETGNWQFKRDWKVVSIRRGSRNTWTERIAKLKGTKTEKLVTTFTWEPVNPVDLSYIPKRPVRKKFYRKSTVHITYTMYSQ